MHHELDPITMPCASTSLRSAARAVSRGYDAALGGGGITINQFAILRRIARAGELPLSRLAERLVMDRTSLYRALEPMTRAGWIRLDPAPRGRARIARLTPQGVAIMNAGAPAWEEEQTALITAFGSERWRALHAELRDLIATVAQVDRSRRAGGPGNRRPRP